MSADQTTIDRLTAIMARLRDPETGCPWDRAQSFATISRLYHRGSLRGR